MTDRSVINMSPRTSSKNEEIRQESMKKIMDSAFRLIAKQGYESTSIAQIAKEAGISKGLLYNYFSSKEELLKQLINHAAAQGDNIMSGLIVDDPTVTLENIFKWIFRELRERPDYFRLLMELTFKIDKFQFAHDLALQKYNGYLKFLEDLLTKIGIPDPKGEASVLAAVFDGIGVQWMVMREDYPAAEIEAFLINKYCKKK